MRSVAFAVVVALGLAMTSTAHAHLRDPYTVAIHFRDAQHVIAGTTFGLLVSDDGGATWRWTCEQALHYKDPFDPDYAITPDGAILMQTTVATWLKRDLCGDDIMPLPANASSVEASPDGALFATGFDGTIYKATSSAGAFMAIPGPATVDAWTSLEVSPADPQRVYLAGFRFVGSAKEHALFVSTDGGLTYAPMSTVGFPTNTSALLSIAGIGPAADTLYIYSQYEDDNTAAIYKSIDAGGHWAKVFSTPDPFGIAFLVRASGQLVAATRTSGASESSDGGTTWNTLAGAPHISTLAESPSGEVWAGTQQRDYRSIGLPEVMPDGYGMMRSTNLTAWSPLAAWPDVQPPVTCPDASPVRSACVDMVYDLGTAWCCLTKELQITTPGTGALDCSGAHYCGGFQDAGMGDVTITKPPPPGCCDAGAADSSPIILALLVVAGATRRTARTRARTARRH